MGSACGFNLAVPPPLPPVGKIYSPSKREVKSCGQNSIFIHQKRRGGRYVGQRTGLGYIQRDFVHLSHRRNLILYSIFYLANKSTTLARAGIVSHLQERRHAPFIGPSRHAPLRCISDPQTRPTHHV